MQSNVALKIVKSSKEYSEVAKDEISILQVLKDKDPENSKCIIHLLDSFNIIGINGTRASIFEYLNN